MKKKLFVLVLLALIGLAAFRFFGAGAREGVAARYREHEVSWTQVQRLRAVLSLLGDKGEADDRAVVDRILRAYILWDEAKALGVTISESEVASALSQLPLPDGKSSLEDYLRTLSGGLAGYLDALKEQARGSISLERLREALARDYCAQQGLDFDMEHLPEEVSRAVGEKLEALLESRWSEVEYCF